MANTHKIASRLFNILELTINIQSTSTQKEAKMARLFISYQPQRG